MLHQGLRHRGRAAHHRPDHLRPCRLDNLLRSLVEFLVGLTFVNETADLPMHRAISCGGGHAVAKLPSNALKGFNRVEEGREHK